MTDTVKKCPFCAEEINIDAVKCRYCKEFLPETPAILNIPKQPILSQANNESIKKDYVKCDSCKKSLRGTHLVSFMGFHRYTCAGCGFTTTYPMGSGYEILFKIGLIFFVLWVFVFFFIDATAGMGLLGLLGLIGIPALLHNSSVKSKHPNYKVEEFNSKHEWEIYSAQLQPKIEEKIVVEIPQNKDEIATVYKWIFFFLVFMIFLTLFGITIMIMIQNS